EAGLPVSVIADGYVSRVSISPSGYGNVLYVTHPNGYTSVYGHLEKFFPDIQGWVRGQQYLKKSFAINLYPEKSDFILKRGQVIGFSGNSGSSGGPHLHFEIRDSETENPVNPLLLGYHITDTRKPVVENLFVFPLSDQSHIERSFSKKRFPLVLYNGAYRLKGRTLIEAYGKIGFGIDAFDYLDGSWSKCGIYKLELWIDSCYVLSFSFDELDYSTMGCLNSHIDYDEYIRNKRRVHKTFVEPGNKLKIYSINKKADDFRFDDGRLHPVRIVMFDVSGNSSEIVFSVKSTGELQPPAKQFSKRFLFNHDNHFKNNEVELFVPNGALFTDIDFTFNKLPANLNSITPIYAIHTRYTPLNEPVNISILAQGLPKNLESKALLAVVNPNDSSLSSVGGNYQKGWVSASAKVFGNYCIAVDTIPPEIISLSIRKKSELIENDKIRFRIKDELSGINTYSGTIDGQWVLFEYDMKNNLITYNFDDVLQKGIKHNLQLRVDDQKGNTSEYDAVFYY
ncbi:MAG: M23 family metallopeptidase, partial [Prolixibacteraceae bacterium]|nr:M23 family metallopeptidase [Prolixibacteraceae bacterium]